MVQDVIRSRIAAFTRELEELVRAAAIDAVSRALGSGTATRAPSMATARPSAPAARPRAAAPTTTAAAPGKLAFKRKKGSKRTPEQLAQIDAAIVTFVKANPGQGIEKIGKGLGVPTDDLKLRMLGLLGAKKLKKTGVKRATKYFAV